MALKRQPEPEYMDLDDEAQAYADADFADVNAAFVDRLLEVAGGVEYAVALDLGTGPVDIPARVLRERPEWRVVAADASFAMLAIGRANLRESGCAPGLVQTDAKRLSLAADAFDVVFSNSILHHITDTAAFWREVARVAKPGATLLLRDLSRPDSEEASWDIVETYSGDEPDLLKEEFHRSLLSAYTPDEVRNQLMAAGLRGLEVEKVTDRHLDIFGRLAPPR